MHATHNRWRRVAMKISANTPHRDENEWSGSALQSFSSEVPPTHITRHSSAAISLDKDKHEWKSDRKEIEMKSENMCMARRNLSINTYLSNTVWKYTQFICRRYIHIRHSSRIPNARRLKTEMDARRQTSQRNNKKNHIFFFAFLFLYLNNNCVPMRDATQRDKHHHTPYNSYSCSLFTVCVCWQTYDAAYVAH